MYIPAFGDWGQVAPVRLAEVKMSLKWLIEKVQDTATLLENANFFDKQLICVNFDSSSAFFVYEDTFDGVKGALNHNSIPSKESVFSGNISSDVI